MMSDDQNFKNLICDFPLAMIELTAPEEAARLPRGVKFKPLRQESLKERLGDSFRELDTPIEVKFPNGEREALLFVFEEESTNRADFLHYLAIVCLNISLWQKTRRVVPIAVHPFRKTPLKTNLKLASDERTYLDFSCISCVLGTMSASDYVDSNNVAARLCLPLMKQVRTDRMSIARRAFEGLPTLMRGLEKRIKYFEFISHYSAFSKSEEKEFFEKYVYKSPYKEDIMTLEKIWRERAEAKGQVKMVLALFKDGILSTEAARGSLEKLAKEGAVPQELVKQALAEIDSASLQK